MNTGNSSSKLWHRREVIKLLGATAVTGPVILRGTTANAATSKVIKIGHVNSQTGVAAPAAEADPFILDQIRTALAKGITNGGENYQVQIISKDSQSNTNRASAVAAELILKDKVDLLVSSGAPDTTNPVADQAEANEVPSHYWYDSLATLLLWPARHAGQRFYLDLPFFLGTRRHHCGLFSPLGIG